MNTLKNDFANIFSDKNIQWNQFRNTSLFITGATGLIGRILIKYLLYLNREINANIKILALVRNIEKAHKVFANEHPSDNELVFIVGDVCSLPDVDEPINYIIHAASETKSKNLVSKPVETIKTTVLGTMNVFQLAKDKNVSSIVYLSSMEAYGVTDPSLTRITESDLGYIDLNSPRSSYPEGKRMAECLATAYYFEYNLPVKSIRLAQTFGAGADIVADTRIFAEIAKCVIDKRNIVLHTKGESEQCYIYLSDAVRAIFAVLLLGKNGEVYNASNELTYTSIVQMAKMVANNLTHGEINVVFDIPESNLQYGYAPPHRLPLNSSKLRELGWSPQVDLEESYRRMIADHIENGGSIS